jgi:hypothetical protein
LAGLGLLAIPGLGPVIAAGWLASAAVGALAGGATGGIIGALTQAGVKDEDAQLYAEGIRRGGTLVSARVPDADRALYESVLNRSAVNLIERSAAYRKAGWNRFDPNASPLSADQIRKVREPSIAVHQRRNGTVARVGVDWRRLLMAPPGGSHRQEPGRIPS